MWCQLDLNLSHLSTLHSKSYQFYRRPYNYFIWASVFSSVKGVHQHYLYLRIVERSTLALGKLAGSWWPSPHPQRALLPHPPEVGGWVGVGSGSNCPPLPRVCVWNWAFVLRIESGEAWEAGSEAHSPLFLDKGRWPLCVEISRACRCVNQRPLHH